MPIAFLLLTQCKKDETEKQPDKTIANAIGIDSQGNKWFAMPSGLYKYDNSAWVKYDLPFTDQKVNSLCIKNDTMLLSTPSGSLLVKIEANSISTISEYDRNLSSIISDTVNAAGFDPNNNIWFGTYWGISFLHGTEWASNNSIIYKLTSQNDNISCIAFRQNDFFFGTYGNYLWHVSYNNETDAVTGASLMNDGFNGRLTTDTIFSLCAGHDSAIWIGSNTGLTSNKGSTHKDHGEFHYYLEGKRIHSILESTDRRIWAGTEIGLCVNAGTGWALYTTTEGLADNFVLSLAEDKEGGIWIGTKNGISCFKNGTFTNYLLQ